MNTRAVPHPGYRIGFQRVGERPEGPCDHQSWGVHEKSMNRADCFECGAERDYPQSIAPTVWRLPFVVAEEEP